MIRTWADEYGRWHARVPCTFSSGTAFALVARRAIRQELETRGELGPRYQVRVEIDPVHNTVPGTITYREVTTD